jgi:acyl dehydratase
MKLFRYLQKASKLHTFKAGDFVKETRIITIEELDKFSDVSGDHNPIHKKSKDVNHKPIVHGAFLNSIVSGIIGTKLPGSGTIVISQKFVFPSKCFIDEPIEIFVELLDVRKIMKVEYRCEQNGSIVFEGEAKITMNKVN